MSNADPAVIRLQKEHRALTKETKRLIENSSDQMLTENFLACPDLDNIFEWYFVVFGLKDCPYEGGFYLGKLIFPKEYPWKPPAIMMVTESGRFRVNAKICLSISDYHPESWNPVWPVKSIIIGLISFMTTDLDTVGSIRMPDD